ncbi:hypothetical protein [Croceivirga thetidis]|uniref:Uncharacterized protein n=1 Tax=Croceivirga thetidis TaxID=2721623 RepID=A0ABX1GM27_9FLAO|nr:hypothetical protein [Croceivirga thetidis]NKI30946.1 hypothetical protein [Croceivirga thetidis]
MIKFFRRIRQKLLTENKFSKYLLYAIGEIILVVIGILIALQINTWNQQKQTIAKERNYLSLIKQEMGTNLEAIRVEQEVLDDFLKNVTKMLALYGAPQVELTNKELSEILVPILSRDMDIYFKDGTLNEIISTGNLKDITNDSIRNILASISGNLERVRAQETRVNNYISKSNAFIEKEGSIKQVITDVGYDKEYGIPLHSSGNGNLHLVKSEEFENIMVFASLVATSLDEEYYSVFEKEIKTLIELIDIELER